MYNDGYCTGEYRLLSLYTTYFITLHFITVVFYYATLDRSREV